MGPAGRLFQNVCQTDKMAGVLNGQVVELFDHFRNRVAELHRDPRYKARKIHLDDLFHLDLKYTNGNFFGPYKQTVFFGPYKRTIFVKDLKFCETSKFLSKIEIFVQNRNFCPKSKFL